MTFHELREEVFNLSESFLFELIEVISLILPAKNKYQIPGVKSFLELREKVSKLSESSLNYSSCQKQVSDKKSLVKV